MSTNTEIITDSLRLLGVLAEGATPTAEQAADCLRMLNQLLATWEIDNITLGYFAQSDPAATCPIPDWAEKGVYGQLALDLAPQFHAVVTAAGLKIAQDGYELILRTLMNLRLKGVDM